MGIGWKQLIPIFFNAELFLMRNCSCCDPYDNSQPIAEPYVLQSGYLHHKIAWQITMKV